MSDEAKNRVQRNKRLIFDAEAYVQFNTAQIQATRSRVEENITDVMQAYTIAAAGNRELIMRSAEDVYRNRVFMLENLKPTSEIEEIFQRSMINRTRIDMLDDRSKMNREMLKASEDLLQAIKGVQQVAKAFLDICEKMTEHVDEVADENAKLFDGELVAKMHAASAISNESRVLENYDMVNMIRENAVGNRKTISALNDASGELSDALGDLQEEANNQRDTMIALREKIDANQRRVADELFKL
jgi:predicted  nucleic acid-binding Zn-ribbon protein